MRLFTFGYTQGCKIGCLLCFLVYCRDVSQSYRWLDVFFFLSLKINPYFYLHAPVELSVEFICFSASTDKIFKHSVHCGLVSLYSIKPYLCKSSNLQFRFFTLGSSVFNFSAETLRPLSKNVYILNSLRIYQRVHVVFTSTSTVWWCFSVVCCV